MAVLSFWREIRRAGATISRYFLKAGEEWLDGADLHGGVELNGEVVRVERCRPHRADDTPVHQQNRVVTLACRLRLRARDFNSQR
eukprot:6208206-Pleurochrysis_carterae.AAC.1